MRRPIRSARAEGVLSVGALALALGLTAGCSTVGAGQTVCVLSCDTPDPILRGVITDGVNGAPVKEAVVHLQGGGEEVLTDTLGHYETSRDLPGLRMVVHHPCYYSIRVEWPYGFGPINVGLPRRPSWDCGAAWPEPDSLPGRDEAWTISGAAYDAELGAPADGLIVEVQGMRQERGSVVADDGTFSVSLASESRPVSVAFWGICYKRVDVLEVWPVSGGTEVTVRLPWDADPPYTDVPFCGARRLR